MYDEYQTRQFWNMKKSELKNIIKEEIREVLNEGFLDPLKQAGEEYLAQDPDRVEIEKKSNKFKFPFSLPGRVKSIVLSYYDRGPLKLHKVKVNGEVPSDGGKEIFNKINGLVKSNIDFTTRPTDEEISKITKVLKDTGNIEFDVYEFDAS